MLGNLQLFRFISLSLLLSLSLFLFLSLLSLHPSRELCHIHVLYLFSLPPSPSLPLSLPLSESVELVECDLAEQTPVISNLQLFDLPRSSGSAHSPSPYQSYIDMASHSQHTVIANLDFTLPAPDSHIVIRARLGGKK